MGRDTGSGRCSASGRDEPATNGERPGHGLAGMRERVSLVGGRLFAGEAEGRYFLVSATLPLDEGNPWIQQ